MDAWIDRLFSHPDLLRMGHHQRAEDRNLGLGWVYYALARTLRPTTVVVIGSYRGFTPLIFAKALSENIEGGRVVFVDPSLVDDFWKDPAQVRAHFESFGARNIEHHRMTTQEFVQSEPYRSLGEVGIAFIDGYHTQEQARFDFEALEPKIPAGGMALFHDTAAVRRSTMYGEEKSYQSDVKLYVNRLAERTDLQVLDLPFARGVTLVRRTS